MPSAFSATTSGSPEESCTTRKASCADTPSAARKVRVNSEALRCSARASNRVSVSGECRGVPTLCSATRLRRISRRSSGEAAKNSSHKSSSARRRRFGSQLAPDAASRSCRVIAQSGGHDRARRRIDCVDQPGRELDELPLLLQCVQWLLHVEVGQDAQQSGADVDAVAQCEVIKTLEARIGGRLRHATHYDRPKGNACERDNGR